MLVLGGGSLRATSRLLIRYRENFPDTMSRKWSADLIADVLSERLMLTGRQTTQPASSKSQKAHVDVVITFDEEGVSSHPNHISLNDGAKAFIKQIRGATDIPSTTSREESSLVLYALRSTNVLRKYLSVFDAPMTMLQHFTSKQHTVALPSSLLFLSNLSNYKIARKAMTMAHKSQMVWFRWGWISLSRYMLLNDLTKEVI